jgi:hypothetical protein
VWRPSGPGTGRWNFRSFSSPSFKGTVVSHKKWVVVKYGGGTVKKRRCTFWKRQRRVLLLRPDTKFNEEIETARERNSSLKLVPAKDRTKGRVRFRSAVQKDLHIRVVKY